MLEKVVKIVWEKNDLFPFELWTVALESDFAESPRNCVLHYFNTSISILIFMPSSNDNYTKVLIILEKVVEIV